MKLIQKSKNIVALMETGVINIVESRIQEIRDGNKSKLFDNYFFQDTRPFLNVKVIRKVSCTSIKYHNVLCCERVID